MQDIIKHSSSGYVCDLLSGSTLVARVFLTLPHDIRYVPTASCIMFSSLYLITISL